LTLDRGHLPGDRTGSRAGIHRYRRSVLEDGQENTPRDGEPPDSRFRRPRRRWGCRLDFRSEKNAG